MTSKQNIDRCPILKKLIEKSIKNTKKDNKSPNFYSNEEVLEIPPLSRRENFKFEKISFKSKNNENVNLNIFSDSKSNLKSDIEIPCKITSSMSGTMSNLNFIENSKLLLRNNFAITKSKSNLIKVCQICFRMENSNLKLDTSNFKLIIPCPCYRDNKLIHAECLKKIITENFPTNPENVRCPNCDNKYNMKFEIKYIFKDNDCTKKFIYKLLKIILIIILILLFASLILFLLLFM